MNVNKFNSFKALYGHTLEDIAICLNRSVPSVQMKITNFPKYCFTQVEIGKLIALWNLTPEDVIDTFFSGKTIDGMEWGCYDDKNVR